MQTRLSAVLPPAKEALLQCLGDEELQVSVSQVSQVQLCHKAHAVIR